MLFRNNPTPFITMVEQSTTPTAPSTGRQRPFLDQGDHKLKRVNENGAIVDLEAMLDVLSAPPSIVVNGKLIVVTDGGSPETISAYYGLGGNWLGPFPLFTVA